MRNYHSQPQTLPARPPPTTAPPGGAPHRLPLVPGQWAPRAKLGFMQHSATPYEERLTAPRSWWLISLLVGVSFALILFPFGTLPILGGLVGGTAAAAVVASAYGSPRIRVVGDSLIAGEAKIPVSALGESEVLDPEEARAWRTHKADVRAFLLLRAYIPRALRVIVTDPDDPTPYLYLSTREPERLAAAIEAAREANAPSAPEGRA
ncbi:Protein of unknown function [Streptomyces misionensis]|uniref:DUF3093 domain-containing protein n=2 Tax=Streptomyces TaxID=1883 RepID=A0A1H5DF95_9ACTN|nr:Protein of unknown function [Streptomyces misionensis]SFY51973.1 hypothetical protein STEPF1_05242 [Streptomyces sp. F-1]